MPSNHAFRLCSDISKANGEDPIGTASSFDRCLLIELPKPWANDVWQSQRVSAELRQAIAQVDAVGLNLKVLAIQPDPDYTQPDLTQVILYSRPTSETAFSRYEREAYTLPVTLVPALVEALLTQPDRLTPFKQYKQESVLQRELLVCTHGSRDSCCGKYGIPLYDVLRKVALPCFGQPLRVWQVSHIGGHRLAGTMLDFPHGHYWGHLNVSILPTLLEYCGSAEAVQPFYRGWAGLSNIAQVAEREIWMREGWRWLEYQKCGRHTSLNNTQTEIELDYRSPDGQDVGSYKAIVECIGQVETLRSSGHDDLTLVDQYAVTSLEKTPSRQVVV